MGNCNGSSEKEKRSSMESDSGTTRGNLIFNTTDRDVADYYVVTKILGEGSMGSVACVRKKTGAIGGSAYTVKKKGFFGLGHVIRKAEVPDSVLGKEKFYALKSIILSRVSDDFLEELRNEIKILQSLDHPNIVKAYEVYENSVNIYLVLEHCSGGDLYSRIPYSEKQSAKIVGKLLSALSHMHQHHVCHRDIKFENIMFESDDPNAEIKLIDFGLSKAFSPQRKFMSEGVGTIYTMAPGVLRGVYTSQADLWSTGVVAFMLLSNTKPFYGKKRRHVVQKILRGEFKFYSKRWNTLSAESKDFVSALIKLDAKERLTADQALQHSWLSNQFPLSDRVPTLETMDSIHASIEAFGEVSAFKKMALMVIAHQSTTEEIKELRKAFDAFDTGNDGTISFVEFKTAMQNSNSNYTDQDIEKLFRSVDTGNDNKIYYVEFLSASLAARGRITEERLADAFDRIDSDDTGFITRDNLRKILGKDCTEEKLDKFFDDGDLNGDGKISFGEFMELFREDHSNDVMAFSPSSTLGSLGSSSEIDSSSRTLSTRF